MKKNKIFLSIITILIAISTSKVLAFTPNAVGYLYTDYNPSGLVFPNKSGTNQYDYKDHKFGVTFNGKTYDAYCLDPGRHFSGSKNLECKPVDSSKPQITWLANNLTGNHLIDQLAIRMLAVYIDLNQATQGVGAEIVQYLQTRDSGDPEKAKTFFAGDESIIESAYALANEARYKTIYDVMNSNGSSVNYSSFRSQGITKRSTNATSSYYEVTVEARISAPRGSENEIYKFNFSCDSCTISNIQRNIEQYDWDPNQVTFRITATIRVINPKCSYKIDLKYNNLGNTNSNSAFVCESQSNQDQNLLAIIPSSEVGSTSGQVIDSFSESITAANGGSYYANYCDSGNQLTCDQQTTVTKPAFCDDAQDKNMQITSPTDIKACILKENDEAGNSYELSSMIGNPYCSVYCKEDYEMTMPGAQFASSGRYFQTRNVAIKGTKTCYTTSPQGINDDNNTNIAIDKFISEIIQAQKDLATAMTAYNKALAEYNSFNNATATGPTTTPTGCNSSNTSSLYNIKVSSINYTEVYITSCNSQTGVCSYGTRTATTSIDETWGTKKNTHEEDNYNSCKVHDKDPVTGRDLATCKEYNKVCKDDADTVTSKPTQKFQNALDSAEKALKSADSIISSKVASFSSCYNWSTDYCFNPDVEFNYQEQYNSNINFEKISGSVTNNTTIGINNQSTIDNAYTTSAGTPSETVTYLGATTAGVSAMHTATNISTLSTHIYHIKKTAVGTAEYQNKQAFQTNYPHGTIDTISEGATPRKNYYYLGAIFPVALNTEYGVYNWTLKFSNVGQFMNEQSCNHLGRLDTIAGSLNSNLGYVCVYVVDCPDCEFSCLCPSNLADGYKCIEQQGINSTVCRIIPPCEGDSCVPSCVGKGCNFCTGDDCIATSDEKYAYRSVSLNDLFPNNRQPGYNWNNQKGQDTIKEIEQNGDSAYQTSQYSYKLTAENMKKIRDYNKQQANSFVGVLEYGNNGNSINATSKFLDDGDKNGYFETIKRNTQWTTYSNVSGNMGPAWK